MTSRVPSAASTALCLAMFAPAAQASDYSGLPVILYGGFAIVFALVFAVVWFMTRPIKVRGLRLLVRAATVAVFWSPVNLGGGGHDAWWPVCCAFLNPEAATEAPASILATTAVLWLLAFCRPVADDRGAA